MITQQQKDDYFGPLWKFAKDPVIQMELFAYFMLYHEVVDASGGRWRLGGPTDSTRPDSAW